MKLQMTLQIACAEPYAIPPRAEFARWATAAADRLQNNHAPELTIRVVDASAMKKLNQTYRGRDSATNVLAFPPDLPAALPVHILGDVVICAEVVAAEAAAQKKLPAAHWAHMVIHGILHLGGYDHIQPAAAAQMEAVETEILTRMGFAAPYPADA